MIEKMGRLTAVIRHALQTRINETDKDWDDTYPELMKDLTGEDEAEAEMESQDG